MLFFKPDTLEWKVKKNIKMRMKINYRLFQPFELIFNLKKNSINQILENQWRTEMNRNVRLTHLSQCFLLKLRENIDKVF